jgi:hypothetical protein
MQRREALSAIGATAFTPWLSPFSGRSLGELHEPGASQGGAGRVLTAAQLSFITALADTIIPRTDTPGAVEVGAPAFVDLLLAEWYSETDRQHLQAGIDALDRNAGTDMGKPFAELDPAGREAFLTALEPRTSGQPAITTPEGTYNRLKSAILTGYLTSRPVAELLRTTPIIPGRFDGCIPLEPR